MKIACSVCGGKVDIMATKIVDGKNTCIRCHSRGLMTNEQYLATQQIFFDAADRLWDEILS